MDAQEVIALTSSDRAWPRLLDDRLGQSAPARLWMIGNPQILAGRKVGLFCSAEGPAEAQARGYDSARKLRDGGITVVSGFHSPVEKECLRILLEGQQPIILCLARALKKIRLSAEWQNALDADRLLLLSQFENSRRADSETARRRNRLVAALADEVLIIHATPGGQIEEISHLINQWGMTRWNLRDQ